MKLFNKEMSSAEARRVLFTAVEGKSTAEREIIKEEYKDVLPAIIKREHADHTMLTSDDLSR